MNVLYVEKIKDINGYGLTLCLLITLIGLVYMMCKVFTDEIGPATIGFFIVLFGFLIAPNVLGNIDFLNKEIIKYKVTIDSDYDINELYDKYDVIEVEGKIFTIEEKDD